MLNKLLCLSLIFAGAQALITSAERKMINMQLDMLKTSKEASGMAEADIEDELDAKRKELENKYDNEKDMSERVNSMMS